MNRLTTWWFRWLGRRAADTAPAVQYRRLFEEVPVGVYQATPHGQLLAANPALLEMLGYDNLEELARLDLAKELYVDPTARAKWSEDLDRQGRMRNVEATLRRKDGRLIVVLDSATAVTDAGGEVIHYEGTLTEITRFP